MSRPERQPRPVALRAERVLWRQLDDRVLVLDVAHSRYLRLNHSGSVLWQALTQPHRPDDLVDVLTGAYDVSREEATDDVAAFLSVLRDRGLLRDPA